MERPEYRGKRLSKYIENYIVFDFETTGISAARDEIIEISAVKVVGHKQIGTYSRLVNPGRPIPADASKINGITDDMVAGEPDLYRILPEFLDFIGADILIGHNIQSFDLHFLYRAAEGLLAAEVRNDFIDTLYMARTCLPQLPRHRLVDLAEYFEISTAGAHRALNDCVMNQLCYEQMGKIHEQMGLPACPKCGGELLQRSGKFGSFYGCGNYPVCRYTKNISR